MCRTNTNLYSLPSPVASVAPVFFFLLLLLWRWCDSGTYVEGILRVSAAWNLDVCVAAILTLE
jgi:hypothetical protein